MRTRNPDFSKITLLYGGSFDPVHIGHLRIVEACRREIPEIEQVLLLPCAQSPGKAGVIADAEARMSWLELTATNGMQIWTEEIERGRESFMVDTLAEAARQGAKRENLYLLVGSDTYASIDCWKEPERLRDFAQIIVANRPNYPVTLADPSDTHLVIEPLAMSSTEIREHLARSIVPMTMLPPAVAKDFRDRILNSTNLYAK